MQEFETYNIPEALGLGASDADLIYEKLKSFSTLTKKNGEVFLRLIEDNSFFNPVLMPENEWKFFDNLSYASEIQKFVINLYPNNFGIDEGSSWHYSDMEVGNYSIDEFYCLCYAFLTTKVTSEKEFLDDFMYRIAVRNAAQITKVEHQRKQSIEYINDYLSKVERESLYDRKTIVLKSANPEEYDNLSIECKVLDDPHMVKSYFNCIIPFSPRVIASDDTIYSVQPVMSGETIDIFDNVNIDGRLYTVKSARVPVVSDCVVVTRKNDPLLQTKLFSSEVFNERFEMDLDTGDFKSINEPKEYVKISENMIINGVLVLAGSYIDVNINGEFSEVIDGKTFEENYSISTQKKR